MSTTASDTTERNGVDDQRVHQEADIVKQTCGRCGGPGCDLGKAEIEVRVLGSVEIMVDGRRIAQWRRRQAELVTLLAISPGRRRSRHAVVAALWPHLPEDRGVANLHKIAHQVRCHTGSDNAVVLDGDVVWLWPDTPVHVDLDRLERNAFLALTDHDPERCGALADQCATGLAPLAGDQPWAQQAGRRLHELHRQLLDTAGRFHDLLALDPTDEAAVRGLMRAALERRDPEGALSSYRQLCHRLVELGLRPMPETVALYHRAAANIHDRAAPARPPLVGEDDHLRRARRRLCHATAGEGGTVLLHGRGSTATRLALAITDEAAHAGCAVLRAATVASSAPTPYGPVRTAVRRLLATRPELAVPLPTATRQHLDRLLSEHHDSDRDPAVPTPATAIGDLLEHAAGLAASVLVLDDLQHADAATCRLIGELADAIRFSPVVVVLTLATDAEMPAHVAALVGRIERSRNRMDLSIRATAAA